MATICRTCGQPIFKGFQCCCGTNKDVFSAFRSKGSQGEQASVSDKGPVDASTSPSGEQVVVEKEVISRVADTDSNNDQNGAEVSSIERRTADLKAEVKRIEGEIDALFKQRKSTSSLEWYSFALDRFNDYNDPNASSGFRGLSLHLSAWALFGFVWIPIGYAFWLRGYSERASWDLATVRAMNRKVNEQIKDHRNRRTSLLDEVNGLKTCLKELAGKNYSPDWRDDPSGAATGALGEAVKGTTSGVGRLVKGVINAVPVKTCPNCQANWAKVDEGEQSVCIRHSSGPAVRKGISVEKGVDGVVTETEYYDELYRCSKCSYRWKVSKVRSKARTDLCPGCYRKGTEEFIREDEVGRQDSVKTQMIRDTVHVDRNDRLVGSTFREVKIHLTTICRRRYSRCKECEQEWHSTSTKTIET